MPPASSRSAATAGHAKVASLKKSVHLNAKRKSIATDPALLQGSSDEDGEGPQDHEEQESSLQEEVSRRTGSTGTSSKSASRPHQSNAALVSAVSNPSPRRSTRLSGEGLESSAAASTSKERREADNQNKPSFSRDGGDSATVQKGTGYNGRRPCNVQLPCVDMRPFSHLIACSFGCLQTESRLWKFWVLETQTNFTPECTD